MSDIWPLGGSMRKARPSSAGPETETSRKNGCLGGTSTHICRVCDVL